MKSNFTKIVVLVVVLLVINLLATKLYKRFDLTADKRYTLSETSLGILDKIDEPAVILVYLEGDFPAEFKRLQTETRQHLEELNAKNSFIKYRFVNPIDRAEELIENGLEPSRLSVQEGGKVSEAVIFPWATIEYNNKKENISLLASQSTGTQEEQLQHSIENLEYAFSNAIHKVSTGKKQNIAILRGNGELADIYITGFGLELKNYYNLAPFTLDSVEVNPQKMLQQLMNYDLAIIAKPTERFTEKEKYAIDQYITHGGKTLWLVDNVSAELDSLMLTGQSVALNRDLNITDLLFSYGVRVNYNLVRDLYSSTIRLASGNTGNKTQYQDFLWPYHPMITLTSEHPITKNVDPVNLKYANTIDTLKNNIQKTTLLESSASSKPVGTPFIISLDEVAKEPVQQDYNNGNQILGVLLEGKFESAYRNRVKPFGSDIYKDQSELNKMVVIADGDIIANDVLKGQPLSLGIDKWTGIRYGNADFLMNTINYMLDDAGILELRSKTIQLQFLDKQKAYQERTFWQLINVLIPISFLTIFGLLYYFIRKGKYS